jgi:hypothetical protein
MLMPVDDNVNDRPARAYPRCEAEKTLRGGYCESCGRVGFQGLLLCERHARLLEAQDRTGLLEGIVSSLELCSRSIPLRKNKDLSVLLRAQRAQATRELARAREDLRGATEEYRS